MGSLAGIEYDLHWILGVITLYVIIQLVRIFVAALDRSQEAGK